MQIVALILLAVIAVLLFKKQLTPRYLAANSNEWLVLEWHKLLDADGLTTWDHDEPIHIEFVPIIGWEYDKYGYKYGNTIPIITVRL
jgi:hypothetical protein